MKKKEYPWTDKAAGKIAGVVLRLQIKFAKCMHTMVADLTLRNMKKLLLIFCLLSGGLSIYFIANAVFRADQKQPSYQIDPINILKHYNETGEELREIIVDEKTYQQIRAFKRSDYFDNTIKARLGLLDSILWLEEMYREQK